MWRQYDQYPRLWLIGWALSNGVNTDKKIPICYKFEKFFMVALVLAFLAICQKSFSNNPSAGSSWIHHSLCPTAHLTGLPQIFVKIYFSNIYNDIVVQAFTNPARPPSVTTHLKAAVSWNYHPFPQLHIWLDCHSSGPIWLTSIYIFSIQSNS